MSEKVQVGLIGCGAISGAYLKYAQYFPILQVAACADLNMDAARYRATEFGVPKVCSVEELFKDDEIDIVLNLTIPKAHVPVSLAAIRAGKHVYCEKPLGVNRAEGKKVIDAARKKSVRVGCAPDTFMGAGIQTARKLIDDGAIGRPIAFTAFMMGPGHESWHPNPQFYYDVGGGPMLDMGPYYLTALLNLLGPVKRITGAASIAIPNRTVTSPPKFGTKIKVHTPDHICGTMEFVSGAVGTIITSFATRFPSYDGKQPITIYGTDATIRVPDPNQFDGPVHIRKKEDPDWIAVSHAFPVNYGRALGLADMAQAIRSKRKHRASGDLGFAVLDLMQGFLDSSKSGKAYKPVAKFARTDPMRADLPFGQLDD